MAPGRSGARPATGSPPHPHVSSSGRRKVTAVDAARVSYHSFLDCYTVPKFGVLSSHGISERLRKATEIDVVSEQCQHLCDSDGKIAEPVMSF